MIPNKIKARREALKLTQTDLANLTGVTRQTIYLIETGKYNPTIRLCKAICVALKTDLNSLFGD